MAKNKIKAKKLNEIVGLDGKGAGGSAAEFLKNWRKIVNDPELKITDDQRKRELVDIDELEKVIKKPVKKI
jgi:hypothetical protein